MRYSICLKPDANGDCRRPEEPLNLTIWCAQCTTPKTNIIHTYLIRTITLKYRYPNVVIVKMNARLQVVSRKFHSVQTRSVILIYFTAGFKATGDKSTTSLKTIKKWEYYFANEWNELLKKQYWCTLSVLILMPAKLTIWSTLPVQGFSNSIVIICLTNYLTGN